MILLVLVILESRLSLIQLGSTSGTETNLPYAGVFAQSIGNPIFQFKVVPGIILARIFSLPLYSVEFLYYFLYQLASGFLMYLFIYRYLDIAGGSSKSTERAIFSLLGGLLYMFFPYNILGDNFPELFFMRALLPLYLLFYMEFIERRKIILFALPSLLLAYMTIMDPRAVLFVPPLAFIFIILPRAWISSGVKAKLAIVLSYVLNVSFSFLLSEFTVTPRLTSAAVSTNVYVPFVLESFRYSLSGILNSLRGLSFEGTYQTYAASSFPQAFFQILLVAQIILPILVFSALMFVVNQKTALRKTCIYILIPVVFTIIIFLFFVNFGNTALFETLLFSIPTAKLPDIIKTLALQFRTPRFTNMTMALIYSIFTSLALSISLNILRGKADDSITLSHISKNLLLKIKVKKSFLKRLSFFILIGLFLFSIVSTVGIFVFNGNFLSGLIDQRTQAYEQVQHFFGYTAKYGGGFLSVPYSDVGWSFSEAPVGMAESVLRYLYAYALDPSIQGSLLSQNQTEAVANILTLAGIKFLIVDGYLGDVRSILWFLGNSTSFSFVTKIGALYVFENAFSKDADIANPVFVLGGMKTYNNLLTALGQLSINSSSVPVFMDGPINWNASEDFPAFGPMFSSPNKSILDLSAPYLVNDNSSLVIAPSQYTRDYDPYNYWSPGYVSDINQGVWTLFCSSLPNFDWDYSYNPAYGYAFTPATAQLIIPFEIAKSGSYQVLVRTLMHPEDSRFVMDVDGYYNVVKTGWSVNSSEFVWTSLGSFDLNQGSHFLNITNEQGSDAINLVLVVPSAEVQRIENFVESFYSQVGVIQLAASFVNNASPYVANTTNANDNSGGLATNNAEQFSLNAIQKGVYSVILEMGDLSNKSAGGIKIILSNQTYPTKIVSNNPLILSVKNVSLADGPQVLKILAPGLNLTSNISVMVYGPEGSLTDSLISKEILPSPNVNVTQISVNNLSTNYNEFTFTFNASSSFMLIFPQAYTGTLKVAFDSSSNVTYTIYSVYDVYTGVWFSFPNGSLAKTFTATLYTEEGRSVLASNYLTVLTVVLVIAVSAVIDVVVFVFLKGRGIKQFFSHRLETSGKREVNS